MVLRTIAMLLLYGFYWDYFILVLFALLFEAKTWNRIIFCPNKVKEKIIQLWKWTLHLILSILTLSTFWEWRRALSVVWKFLLSVQKLFYKQFEQRFCCKLFYLSVSAVVLSTSWLSVCSLVICRITQEMVTVAGHIMLVTNLSSVS